ncbi:hypothetical protein DL93DRAFT_1567859 [Clavulina sp. PMI_390]|nr:hypothetical protein DL93DRAFT_1567859 [Clavulina sp. PMI_390]
MDATDLSAAGVTSILSSFPSLEELAGNSWNASNLPAAHLLGEFVPGPDGHWHWKCPRLKLLGFSFSHTLKTQRSALKSNTDQMAVFEQNLSTALLNVLKELVAERVRGENSQLHVHVDDIHPDLQDAHPEEDWSAVHVAKERDTNKDSESESDDED